MSSTQSKALPGSVPLDGQLAKYQEVDYYGGIIAFIVVVNIFTANDDAGRILLTVEDGEASRVRPNS